MSLSQGNCLGASEILSYDDATTTGVAAACPVDNVLPPSFEWPYEVPISFNLALFAAVIMVVSRSHVFEPVHSLSLRDLQAAFAFYQCRPGTGSRRRSWIPGAQQYSEPTSQQLCNQVADPLRLQSRSLAKSVSTCTFQSPGYEEPQGTFRNVCK